RSPSSTPTQECLVRAATPPTSRSPAAAGRAGTRGAPPRSRRAPPGHCSRMSPEWGWPSDAERRTGRVVHGGLNGRRGGLVGVGGFRRCRPFGALLGQAQQQDDHQDGPEHHEHLVPPALVRQNHRPSYDTCNTTYTLSVTWLSTSKSPAMSA